MFKQQSSPSLEQIYKINQQIRAKEVRLINENGEMLGVVPLSAALELAEEAGLDLVEVSPNAEPPVCKIADFGKMKYQVSKKAVDTRKKQKVSVIKTKEVKMRVNIGKGDYNTKVRNAINFLKKGDKVKFFVAFKGREISHPDLAREILDKVLLDTEEFGKVESAPRFEGRQMTLLLSSK